MENPGFTDKQDVLDSRVIKMPETHPAYFGVYHHFNELRKYLDKIKNLFLAGKNGMHKLNNQDHSMRTAITAVNHIASGITDKSAIWAMNTEQDCHDEK